MSRPNSGGSIRCVHVGNCEHLPSSLCRCNEGEPRALRDPLPDLPPIDRVLFLIQGGRERREVGVPFRIRTPNRKYVVKGLHNKHALTDYLSVQVGTEKRVTPLFRQLTMPDMKGIRKASTPSQWRRDFIKRVQQARKDSGKRPIEVAAELGVNLDTYNRWETRSLLPHHLVMPFCRSTGADPVELLTGVPFDLGKLLRK